MSRREKYTRERSRRYNLTVYRIPASVITLFLALNALAQRKPVTIDAITAKREITGFAPIQWAPDGKRFAWLEDKQLWTYDVTARQKKKLLDLMDLENKAVKPPEPEVFDWKNRRVSEQQFAWSNSGKDVLISTGGDLFLLHIESGK